MTLLFTAVIKGKTNMKTQDKKWMRLGDKMINQQKVVFCLAEFSQVKRRAIKLPYGAICYVHFPSLYLYKVVRKKVLPLVCVVLILAYWTLGLTLPSSSNVLDNDVSDCSSPDIESFDVFS